MQKIIKTSHRKYCLGIIKTQKKNAGYKIDISKPVLLLCVNNKKSEQGNKEDNSIYTKKNRTLKNDKQSNDLVTENYKELLKEIKDINEFKDISCS